MAFDGVPIGISDGLPKNRRFCLGRCRVSGCPDLENALGAVEMFLVPSDCIHFDAPAGPPKFGPKLAVGSPPGLQLFGGGHAGIYVDEQRTVLFDGNRHLDVEIPDASVGASGVDAFRE